MIKLDSSVSDSGSSDEDDTPAMGRSEDGSFRSWYVPYGRTLGKLDLL